MEEIDITIIGAGIIGLAISAFCSEGNSKAIYVLEKNTSFGQETSSRNSEVVHSGIYYPPGSLKAITCSEGNRMLYEICEKNNIGHKKTGKLIVANEQAEVAYLEKLLRNGADNGVSGLRILEKQEISLLEPNVKAQAALYSAHTGIVDSHSLMSHFLRKAKSQGVEFAFNSEVRGIDKEGSRYKISVCDADGSDFSYLSRLVINCAGLNSDIVAGLSGIDTKEAGYILRFCKGEYFRVISSKSCLVQRLVYPVPETASLGIHATVDLSGGLRLGPDARYIERDQANYNINGAKMEDFSRAVKGFLPFIESSDLSFDTAGIRPKLQGPQEGFRDFVICHEDKRGLPGLINLIGIESPGLTSSPSIAKYVRNIVEELI